MEVQRMIHNTIMVDRRELTKAVELDLVEVEVVKYLTPSV